MAVLSFVTVSRERTFQEALQDHREVEVRGHVEQLADLVEVVDEQRPDALLVSLDRHPDAVFDTLEKLLSPRPLLIFHGPDDSRLILRAMRSGGYEYIAPAPDAEEQLFAAIHRAALDRVGSDGEEEAPLLAVMGSKGGVGTTFVACQLAASLASSGARVALADGNLRHGDVALYFDLSPRYDFASLIGGDDPIDATYLQTALAPHDSGVAVLGSPRNPEDARSITTNQVTEVLGLLRAEFDWVLWDTPHEFDDHSVRVLAQATQILLVTTPDVPALHHTKLQLETLTRLGHSDADVKIVLNRTDTRASVSDKDATGFLERGIDANIPNDFPRASACVNEGRTLTEMAPRSPIERGFAELDAQVYVWLDRVEPEPTRKGFLDRFKGLRSS